MRPAWKGLVAFGIYLALACVIWLPPIGAAIGTRYVGDGWADARFYRWALAWTPWAVLHGHSPLFASNVFAPDGVDLTWITFVPSLGIITYPLQRVAGTLVTLNLLMLVAPALAAWATYLVCHRITRRFWPSVMGGLFFGFSTFIAGHMTDHVNLVLAFPVPLAVYLVVRRVEGSIGWPTFVGLLTLNLVFLFGTSTEIFATSAALGAVAMLLALVFAGKARGVVFRTALLVAMSYVLCAVIVMPFLLAALRNQPAEVLRPVDRTVVDLASWVVPREHTWIGGGDFTDITSRFTASAQEDAGYVGIAALLMVLGYVVTERRRGATWALLLFLLIVAVFAAGPVLRVLGRPTVTMPGTWVVRAPFLQHSTAQRLPMYATLALGVIAAMWLAHASGRWAWTRWVVVGAAALMVLPAADPGPLHAYGTTPGFFTSGDVYDQIRQGETVLSITERPGTELDWLAESNFWYQLAQGYVGVAMPAAYEGQPLYRGLAVNQLNPYIPTPEAFADWLRTRGVTAVMLDDDAAWKFQGLLESVGLQDVHQGDGVSVWRPGPKGYQARDPAGVVIMGDAEHVGGVVRTFSLPSLQGSDRIEGPNGRPTVFTFVGPDCGECAAHLQAVEAFAKAHPELRVIAISSWDTSGANDQLLRSLDLPHVEVGLDPLGRIATAMYGSVTPNLDPPTPYSVLMGADGTILARADGVWSDQTSAAMGST